MHIWGKGKGKVKGSKKETEWGLGGGSVSPVNYLKHSATIYLDPMDPGSINSYYLYPF